MEDGQASRHSQQRMVNALTEEKRKLWEKRKGPPTLLEDKELMAWVVSRRGAASQV